MELAGAGDGVWEGENAEGCETEVKCRSGELEVHTVHEGSVDFCTVGVPVGGGGRGNGGAVGRDEIRAYVDGGDVNGWVGGEGGVE